MAPETGEAGWFGFAAGEFAVGKDADEEEPGGVQQHFDDQLCLEVEVEQGAGHQEQAAEGRCGTLDGTIAIALEYPDEAEKVDEQGENPDSSGAGTTTWQRWVDAAMRKPAPRAGQASQRRRSCQGVPLISGRGGTGGLNL